MPTLSTPFLPRSQKPICLPYTLVIYVHSFSRDFRLQFWVGVANPQTWGRGGRRGSEIVPFERALMHSYRPSIVTFHLSLRVSEILPLLFSNTPLFPYPTSIVPQNFHMFPWEWVDRLFATKSEGVGLIVCAITFQDFQPIWSQSTNVTDRRTYRRTTCDRKTITLCTKVHCAVKTFILCTCLLWQLTVQSVEIDILRVCIKGEILKAALVCAACTSLRIAWVLINFYFGFTEFDFEMELYRFGCRCKIWVDNHAISSWLRIMQ